MSYTVIDKDNFNEKSDDEVVYSAKASLAEFRTTLECSKVAQSKLQNSPTQIDLNHHDVSREASNKIFQEHVLGKREFQLPSIDVLFPHGRSASTESISFAELLATPMNQTATGDLLFLLGKDDNGVPLVENLVEMPHLLVAGTVFSGKSMIIHCILTSLLIRSTPHALKLILIDLKLVEFSQYNNIPHLLLPVVTDICRATLALQWAVREMERRLRLMADEGVRSLLAYNKKRRSKLDALDKLSAPDEDHLEFFSRIVIVIDELTTLTATAKSEVEDLIVRITQMGHVAGIHLICVTQRPSVDILSSSIKANLPARIAFRVVSKVDSVVILGSQGAEQLATRGQALFLRSNKSKPIRINTCLVTEEETERLVSFIRNES